MRLKALPRLGTMERTTALAERVVLMTQIARGMSVCELAAAFTSVARLCGFKFLGRAIGQVDA